MLENTKQLKLLPLTTASKLARETEAAAHSNSLLARTLACGAQCVRIEEISETKDYESLVLIYVFID